MNDWTTVAIGDVLTKSQSWIKVDPDAEYKEVTVKLWGKGLELRGLRRGVDIGSARRLRVDGGQFLISRIDARHGAFGILPDELNGAIVSNDFPAYVPNSDCLDTGFLGWLSKTPGFVAACRQASEGTTNRVRLKEDRFQRIEIPLPPLPEQRRIVAKIDALAAKIDEARRLREGVLTDARALLRSRFAQIIEGAEYRPMAEVAPIVRRPVEIEMDGEYPELGVRSFSRGVFHKPTLQGIELDWQKLFRIHAGDLVISNIKAWEGAIAVAGRNDHERVASHRYITCVPPHGVTTSDFVAFYLLSPEGLDQVQLASPGSADRNRTLAMKRLNAIEVPIPPYAKQLEFNRLQAQVAAIRAAQASNQTELDALLPSILDRAFKGEL